MIWGLRYLPPTAASWALPTTPVGGFLLFWKAGTDKDDHRLALPASTRELDMPTPTASG